MPRMPKRIKFRKQMRGKMKGNATRGNYVAFGEYGLQSLDTHWVSARQIEAGRIAAQQRHALRDGGPWKTSTLNEEHGVPPFL